jgi:hypothetical protein
MCRRRSMVEEFNMNHIKEHGQKWRNSPDLYAADLQEYLLESA